MDFSRIGSISNYTKTLKLQTQWELKKNSGNVNSHVKSLNDLLSGTAAAEQETDFGGDDRLSKIMNKVYAGRKLSGEELDYLQSKAPELYEKVRDAEREQESYKKELRQCKTKEDVQRLKMNHIGNSLATVKAVESNPHIPLEKKLAIAQVENGKVTGIEEHTRNFVKSEAYKKLPTEAEQTARWEAEAQERRDSFTPADGDNALKLLTPEEAAQLRSQGRGTPVTLPVGLEELTDNAVRLDADNVTFNVDGVAFSSREMNALKEITANAISLLPPMGSDLDYNDHASMGLAVNAVKNWAMEHLTEDQSAAAVKSMENYMNRLANAQSARPSEKNAYYGESNPVPKTAAEELRRRIAALSGNHSTLLNNLSHAEGSGGLSAAATNKDLSDTLRDDFAAVDLRDKTAVKDLLARYRDQVTPAYRAWGLGDTEYDTSLSARLNQDADRFSVSDK